jgi:hypothetical protein
MLIACLLQISAELLYQASVIQQHRPPSIALAQDTYMLVVRCEVQVLNVQGQRLPYSQAGLEDQTKQHPIAQSASRNLGQDREGQLEREWEKELSGRILDPVQYIHILDRGFEKAQGYAPFLARQRAARQEGGWRMSPLSDPLLNCTSLRELLPSFPAVVGHDGTVELPGGGQGWHYRDYDEDVLGYFPGESVTVQPSPLAEAAAMVYWRGSVLCYAVADELRHDDGSYRPYWFPYPRLGE